jgi:hypothetical protein
VLRFDECTPQVADLIQEFVYSERPTAQDVTLGEFLQMFAKLEKNDVGVNMV